MESVYGTGSWQRGSVRGYPVQRTSSMHKRDGTGGGRGRGNISYDDLISCLSLALFASILLEFSLDLFALHLFLLFFTRFAYSLRALLFSCSSSSSFGFVIMQIVALLP